MRDRQGEVYWPSGVYDQRAIHVRGDLSEAGCAQKFAGNSLSAGLDSMAEVTSGMCRFAAVLKGRCLIRMIYKIWQNDPFTGPKRFHIKTSVAVSTS